MVTQAHQRNGKALNHSLSITPANRGSRNGRVILLSNSTIGLHAGNQHQTDVRIECDGAIAYRVSAVIAMQ